MACLEDHRHGLEDGDYVTFHEIKGMTELNGAEPMKVSVTGELLAIPFFLMKYIYVFDSF